MNRLLSIARAIRRDQRQRAYESTKETKELRCKRETVPKRAEPPTNEYERMPPPVFVAGMRVIVSQPPDRRTGFRYEPWAGTVERETPGVLWVRRDTPIGPGLDDALYNVHADWCRDTAPNTGV